MVWTRRGPARLRRRRAGHAPPRRGARPPGPRRPRAQARPRRAARRRVRRAAAAARARPRRPRPALADRPSTRWPRWRAAATSGATTARTSPRRTASCACSSTGCSCSACAAPTCCPPRTTPTPCAGSPARPSCGPTGATTPSACSWRSGGATPGGSAGCTRSSSTGRCSTRRRGCPTTGLSPEAATVRLGALGWASPEGALHHLRALTGGVSRAASIQKTLLPVLLDELARTPDPDRGLLAYRRVSEALARTPWYLRLLRDEGLVAERLMRLLGHVRAGPGPARARAGGAAAARRTGRRPRRRADPRPGRTPPRPLRTAVGRQPDPTGRRDHRPLGPPPRAAPDRVRGPARARWTSSRSAAGSRAVWAAVLQGVLASALRALGGSTPPARLAVIAMGRLGGGGAGLRQRRGRPVRLRAARRARRTTRPSGSRRPWPRPSGASSAARARTRRWSIDADLRPEGRSGPLVRTLGVLPGVLRPLVGGLGGAGPAAGPPDRGRRRARAPVPRARRPDPLPEGRAQPGGGHRDPPDQGPGRRGAAAPRRRPDHAHEARPRRARRRRVDGAAPAAPARRRRPRAAHDLDAGRAARGRRGGPAHRTTTPRSSPRAG